MAGQQEHDVAVESFQEDLFALREKYLEILETQVIEPLHGELTERCEGLRRQCESADAAARPGIEARIQMLESVLALVEDGQARIRHLGVGDLRAFFGDPSPTF